MRRLSLTILLSLLFPYFVQAQCLDTGYTVVFVNGILTSKDQAESSRKALEIYLGKSFKGQLLNVRLGYNESHLAGAGDLLQAAAQGFGGSVTDFDRDTILIQIHPEVTTRKLLLVGHSQGTFYSNNIYQYLLDHGEPKEDVGVYNVATPASYVAGGGAYITSSLDSVISLAASVAKDFGAAAPLPANINIWGRADGRGHSFTEVYLAEAGDQIVGEIQDALSKLKTTQGTGVDGCFNPPDAGLGYNLQKAAFVVADPTVSVAWSGLKLAYQGAVLATNATAAAVGAIGSALSSLNPFARAEPRTENIPGSFTVVKTLYGSSLDEADLNDLLGTSQGGAVVQATTQKQPPPEPKGEVQGSETQKNTAPQPAAPLVPFPSVPELPSPGFGGGGTPAAVVEDTAVPGTPVTPKTVSIVYTFDITDANAVTASCAFDTDPPVACSSTFSKELGVGEHTFVITATDEAGNQSTETRHFTVIE